MNHPHPDELLLFATGELDESRIAELAAHVGECAPCRETLARIDESLVALDAARPYRLGRRMAWAGVALAAAATVAVLLVRQADDARPADAWVPTTTWSATAGYVAGGRATLDIDAQLTRLEQEPYYGRP